MPAPQKSELRLLRPSTRCATITPRPDNYKSGTRGGVTHHAPRTPENDVSNAFLTSVDVGAEEERQPELSGEELLAQFKEVVKSRHGEIKQAFYSFDSDRSSFVSLAEFRQIIENFIFPLSHQQYDQLIKRLDGITNNRLNYSQFMFKISRSKTKTPALGRVTPANDSLDNIVAKLQERLRESSGKIFKAMRMFDQGLTGRIKKGDLRRVIENFAFHLSKDQFERLYKHYATSSDGTISYMSFFKSVSSTRLPIKPASASPTGNALVIFEEEEAEQRAEEEAAKPREPLWCETVPLVEVEIRLRNKIKHKIQLLYRTFKSMDLHGEGYITIEQLRRALDRFAFPMTDPIFGQLMERLDVKAKHRLRYEVFLDKLQDRRVGGYGQTLVMKPNHKFYPIIESTDEPSLETLLSKLKTKIVNGYSSIRQAFLVFDENKTGRVARRDFKNVIDGFCFRLSEAQFSKLMTILDPSNKGFVTYPNFFKLFDDAETSEGHPWLTSVHRVNKSITPAYLEDAQFEEVLAKKITDDKKMVSLAFGQYDREGTGVVSKPELKKFLERFRVPFSKVQFEKLLGRCTENSDGTVNFYQFMAKLGVDLQAIDQGLSEQIADENMKKEHDRAKDHRDRLEVVAQRAIDHTGTLGIEKVLVQLQDYMHQRASDMRKLFLKHEQDGRIRRQQFKKLLAKAGFIMEEAQFKELCVRMSIGRSLSYNEFLAHFQGIGTNGEISDAMLKTTWSPKIVPGAPVTAMPYQEGLALFRTKIQNSYRNLRAAFHAIDRDGDGLVNRTDLVAILTKLLIPMSREDITDMWNNISNGKKRLNVQQFVAVFEEAEDVSQQKWLVSVHKPIPAADPSPLSGEAVLRTFRVKALDQYFSLSKCFTALDKDGKGRLNKKKLRQALHDFCIPINKDEFQKLWKHFDDDGIGYVDHEKFVRRTAEDFNPGDNTGTSTHIVESSVSRAEQFGTEQMVRRDDLLVNHINTLKCMSNEEVERQFRLNMHEHYTNLRAAFKASDRENLGYLRKIDLRRILFDFNFLVDDDQFDFLLQRCGMEKKSRMSYEKFLKFFEGPQTEVAGIDNFDALENRIAPYIASYPELGSAEATARMKYCVGEIREVLQQAFQALDTREYGILPCETIRRVLDNFCFIMTDKQFTFMAKKLPYVSDGRVDYKLFLDYCTDSSEEGAPDIESFKRESKGWLEAVLGSNRSRSMASICDTPGRLSRRSKSCTNLVSKKGSGGTTAPFVMADHIEQKIDHVIREQWMELHKYFRANSTDGATVSEGTFKVALEKNGGIVLTSEELALLCRKYDTKGDGNVHFASFLKKFSALGRISALGRPLSQASEHDSLHSGRLSSYSYNLSRAASCTSLDLRPDSARSVSRSISSQMGLRRSTTALGDLTPGPGIDPPHYVISNIAGHVVRNWKQLRKLFKECDTGSKGWIGTSDFRNCMRRNHVDISESDFSDLISFYESQSSGKVFYNDFLRAFLSVSKDFA